MHVAVIGVSGCGKSTVAELLAERLGWRFADADAFHPPANVAKMAAGQPLDDADRAPWLDAIAAWLEAHRDESIVLACSALKQSYRARLGHVRWVYLRVPREVLVARLAARRGHFFSPALLATQLDTLEEPGPGEGALTVDATLPPGVLAEQIAAALKG